MSPRMKSLACFFVFSGWLPVGAVEQKWGLRLLPNWTVSPLAVNGTKGLSVNDFYSGLESSGWLRHIKAVMDAAIFLAKVTFHHSHSIVVFPGLGRNRFILWGAHILHSQIAVTTFYLCSEIYFNWSFENIIQQLMQELQKKFPSALKWHSYLCFLFVLCFVLFFGEYALTALSLQP